MGGATLNISEGGNIKKSCGPRIKKSHVIFGGVILLIFALILIAYLTGAFSKLRDHTKELSPPNPTKQLPSSQSILHTFGKAAVCADGPPCAEIGKKILLNNGSAIDAALAALFCNGLVNMQSMGMGGGFLMTMYIRKEKQVFTLNARETAPMAATADMFKAQPDKSQTGPLAIGVPGELRGYWEAHKRFGKLPWKAIVQPTIELCESGYTLAIPQHKSLQELVRTNDPNFKEWFLDDKGKLKPLGSVIKPTKLCNTLKLVAENGGDDLYNGTLAKMLAADLKAAGSLITAKDLEAYKVEWSNPIAVDFKNGDHLYSVPPPGSGVLLGFILKILDGYNFNKTSIADLNSTLLTYHRIAEAFKYAYAKRTELGDMSFVNISKLIADLTSPKYAEEIRMKISDKGTNPDPLHYGAVFYNQRSDNGTAHVSVLAENGDAVSVTSTINLYFGAKMTSPQTGITLNSIMDDFSSPNIVNYFGLPGSPNNAIAPAKRPLSSMTPSIITDKQGDVRLVIGASGGTQITTGVAMVIMRILWFDQNIKEAVDLPRLHHQLYPMDLSYEYGTTQDIVDGLEKFGHNTTRLTSFSVICALLRKGNMIFANADHRKGGDVYGIN